MLLPCRAVRAGEGMHANVLSRVMLLRQTLLQNSDAEAVQDLLQQANALMQMMLRHDVSVDLSCTARENKVAELVRMCAAIRDDELKARVSVHLQNVMSACVSTCMCSASSKPNTSDTMSTHDKLQHVRASLLSNFQA
jgi:hypothetical protein